MVPTLNPADVTSVLASASGMPTSVGTGSIFGPMETSTVMVDPRCTRLPSVGSVPATSPAGTVLEFASPLFTTKPASSIVLLASAGFIPATAGIVSSAPGPAVKNHPSPPPSAASAIVAMMSHSPRFLRVSALRCKRETASVSVPTCLTEPVSTRVESVRGDSPAGMTTVCCVVKPVASVGRLSARSAVMSASSNVDALAGRSVGVR